MAKQIEIELPKGYTFKEVKGGKIICEEVKHPTYDDVAKELFYNKIAFYTEYNGDIESDHITETYKDPNNATSKRQLEKLLAINKLMNVAKYLNGDWKPDWEETTFVWSIFLNHDDNMLDAIQLKCVQYSPAVFKSKEDVQKAIEILGEDTIKLALCTDY